jgi:RND family efflux transporter MFP subunit
MNAESKVDSKTDDTPPAARRIRFGWLVTVAVGLAFTGWFGVRVRAAMRVRDAQATERNDAAREAAQAAKDKTRHGQTVQGRAGQHSPTVQLEGTLVPAHEADLGFKVPGRLASIRARLGARVGAGDVLATLDQVDAEAQVRAAEAQVRAAEAQLALAEDSQKRTQALVSSGSVAEANGIQVTQQRSLVAAQLDAARAQLALAQSALRNHILTAPFAGSVTKVPSGAGTIVNPGASLFQLQDTQSLKLAGTLGEADALYVKPGAAVELRADGRTLTGHVTAVLSSVDPATRRVRVEAELKNDGSLLAGSFIRAQVVGLKPIAILRLPGSTLRPGSQNEVMVVRNGRLETRHIVFTVAQDGDLLVGRGLGEAEQVLVSPQAEAQDGDLIAINNEKTR